MSDLQTHRTIITYGMEGKSVFGKIKQLVKNLFKLSTYLQQDMSNTLKEMAERSRELSLNIEKDIDLLYVSGKRYQEVTQSFEGQKELLKQTLENLNKCSTEYLTETDQENLETCRKNVKSILEKFETIKTTQNVNNRIFDFAEELKTQIECLNVKGSTILKGTLKGINETLKALKDTQDAVKKILEGKDKNQRELNVDSGQFNEQMQDLENIAKNILPTLNTIKMDFINNPHTLDRCSNIESKLNELSGKTGKLSVSFKNEKGETIDLKALLNQTIQLLQNECAKKIAPCAEKDLQSFEKSLFKQLKSGNYNTDDANTQIQKLGEKYPGLKDSKSEDTPYGDVSSHFNAANQILSRMQTLKKVQEQIETLKNAQGKQAEELSQLIETNLKILKKTCDIKSNLSEPLQEAIKQSDLDKRYENVLNEKRQQQALTAMKNTFSEVIRNGFLRFIKTTLLQKKKKPQEKEIFLNKKYEEVLSQMEQSFKKTVNKLATEKAKAECQKAYDAMKKEMRDLYVDCYKAVQTLLKATNQNTSKTNAATKQSFQKASNQKISLKNTENTQRNISKQPELSGNSQKQAVENFDKLLNHLLNEANERIMNKKLNAFGEKLNNVFNKSQNTQKTDAFNAVKQEANISQAHKNLNTALTELRNNLAKEHKANQVKINALNAIKTLSEQDKKSIKYGYIKAHVTQNLAFHETYKQKVYNIIDGLKKSTPSLSADTLEQLEYDYLAAAGMGGQARTYKTD